MQYNFLGFSVAKMMELELDMKDLAILRYFIDFRDTGKMSAEVIDGKSYYWINYNYMADEMPFLCLGKKAIMTRMHKLRDLGILIHYTKKEGGTFSYFAIGPKYIELISNSEDTVKEKKKSTNVKKAIPEKGEGIPQKGQGVSLEKDNGYPWKRTTKILLSKDYSTKEINIKKDTEDIINYLNEKVNARYRADNISTSKLISIRLKEKYSVDDFKQVIDKKAKEWIGTTWEQYLTPQTLFGNKFDQYLNQNIKNNVSEIVTSKINKPIGFNNFEAREYDYDNLEKKLLGWE